MKVRIRLAATEESHLVYALMKAAFATSASEAHPSSALWESVDDVEQAMTRGGGLLSLRDGRPIGSGRFEVSLREGWLSFERLSVLEAERGHGVGSKMITWLEEHARDLGLREVRVCARSREPDNRPYYQARGYEITGYSERYGIPDIRTHLHKPL